MPHQLVEVLELKKKVKDRQIQIDRIFHETLDNYIDMLQNGEARVDVWDVIRGKELLKSRNRDIEILQRIYPKEISQFAWRYGQLLMGADNGLEQDKKDLSLLKQLKIKSRTGEVLIQERFHPMLDNAMQTIAAKIQGEIACDDCNKAKLGQLQRVFPKQIVKILWEYGFKLLTERDQVEEKVKHLQSHFMTPTVDSLITGDKQTRSEEKRRRKRECVETKKEIVEVGMVVKVKFASFWHKAMVIDLILSEKTGMPTGKVRIRILETEERSYYKVGYIKVITFERTMIIGERKDIEWYRVDED